MEKVKAIYSTFVFIGETVFNDEKYYTSKVSENGYKYSKIQFGLKTNDSNVAYVEMMGGFSTTKKNIIYAMDKDKNKMEIDFNDRFDANILSTVMDFKKIKINFTSTDEKDSKIFISEFDAVEEIKSGLCKGKRIAVFGNVSVERYEDQNGQKKTTMKFIPNKIRLAKDDEENKAEVNLGFVFDKESLDEGRLVKEGKIDVTGYFTVYEKNSKTQILVPMPLVLDIDYLTSVSKVQLDEKNKGLMIDMYKRYFQAETGEYYETAWKAEVFRGSVAEEITEDDLSDDQKLQIQFGVVSFEQIKKEMQSRKSGEKINEIKLIRPLLKFQDDKENLVANVLTKYTEENFFIPEVKTEDKNQVFSGDGQAPQNLEGMNDDDAMKALFG